MAGSWLVDQTVPVAAERVFFRGRLFELKLETSLPLSEEAKLSSPKGRKHLRSMAACCLALEICSKEIFNEVGQEELA